MTLVDWIFKKPPTAFTGPEIPPVEMLLWFVGPLFQYGAKEIVALKDILEDISNSSHGAAYLDVDVAIKV
jgi:hypothetical protein